MHIQIPVSQSFKLKQALSFKEKLIIFAGDGGAVAVTWLSSLNHHGSSLRLANQSVYD